MDDENKENAQGQTFPCPKCGGELKWDPAHQEMRCPYCSSLIAVPAKEDFEARERDLTAFLENHEEAEGYGVQLESLTCKSCGATIQIPPGRVDLTCPFCATRYILEEQEPVRDVIKPKSLIPFKIDKTSSMKRFRAWIGKGWFRPRDLKKLGRPDKILGLYLPFFTFDALARSVWSAMAGYYYYVTERVQVQEDGKTVWKEQQVRKIRWENANGQRSDFYDDVLIPAVHQDRLNLVTEVYPFDMTGLMAFNTSYLSGFGVLSADMPLKQVYLIAKADMEGCQRKRCSGDVPGDTQRDLRVSTAFSEQTFKHLLCPLWVGSFKYKGNVFPFVVNGQTGKLYGKKPWSWMKISAALLLCAFLLFLFYWFFLRGA